jgi:hypothetical protein
MLDFVDFNDLLTTPFLPHSSLCHVVPPTLCQTRKPLTGSNTDPNDGLTSRPPPPLWHHSASNSNDNWGSSLRPSGKFFTVLMILTLADKPLPHYDGHHHYYHDVSNRDNDTRQQRQPGLKTQGKFFFLFFFYATNDYLQVNPSRITTICPTATRTTTTPERQ